jgi:hypothetical protein
VNVTAADIVAAAHVLAAEDERGRPIDEPLARLEQLVAARATPAAPPVAPRRTYTRTRTFYFREDRVAPLMALLDDLFVDWEARRPHIDSQVAANGDARLVIARHALGLLAEPVAE